MPIYEYRCQSCGHELESLQRMSDSPLTDCPACGKSDLRRLISAAGFRLKGGGWYETDFKKDNRRNLADGGDKSGASDGGSSSADAKPSDSAKSPEKSKSSESTKSTGGQKGSSGTADAA